MKISYSGQGLSEIIEESDREDNDHPRRQLAKLSNHEFLNQYVNLNRMALFHQQYQHLMEVPLNPNYSRFVYNGERDAKMVKKELAQSMIKIQRAQKAVLSKDQLKQLAARKLEQSRSKERLSTSRREKRDQYYEKVKTNRNFYSERLDKSGSHYHSIDSIDQSKSSPKMLMEEPAFKDCSTEQSIEDQFAILQRAGEERDRIKKQWYHWGEKAKLQERKALLQIWIKSHNCMKQLLEKLLQKLSQQVGSPEIFRQFRVDSSLLLSRRSDSKASPTLLSTSIMGGTTALQTRWLSRFNNWFNKLLLDQRQLSFAGGWDSSKRLV